MQMNKLFSQIKKTPQIMGILNLTPDSFYDGGRYADAKQVLNKVGKMLEEGANIIDVGAYSSRPNAQHISEEEEIKRLLPILKSLVKEYPKTMISIDTFRSKVARQSVDEGAQMINDISGGNMDHQMFKTMADLKVPYVLMHMQGTPQSMQEKPSYHNVTDEVSSFFKNKLLELQHFGLNDVILDVGFGFGKTIDQNYELLHSLAEFRKLAHPILVGVSRKSMLYKVIKSTPAEALNATSIAHTIALLNGADILRVHDVKEAQEVVRIVKQYKKND